MKAPVWSAAKIERQIDLICTDHRGHPKLETYAREMLRLRFEANSSLPDWKTFRAALLLGRDGHADDPVEFAFRAVAAKHAITEPGKVLAFHLKAAETATSMALRKVKLASERASKSAVRKPRVFGALDERYLHELGWAEQRSFLADRALVEEHLKKKIGRYSPPHWDHLTEALRVLTWSIVTHEAEGFAFTIQPGGALGLVGGSRIRGIASTLQERIRDRLKDAFSQMAPDFWFVVEERGGRVHLHGGILPVPTPSGYDDLKVALLAAAGKWDASSASSRQVDLRRLTGPYNWASYALKHIHRTRLETGSNVTASTRPLAARAKERWPKLRRELPSV